MILKLKHAFVFLLSLTAFSTFAQQNFCGSQYPEPMRQWLNQFQDQADPTAVSGNREIQYLPIQFHLVGRSNETGFYRLQYLWDILCELNAKFEPVGFYFYLYGDLNYIANDSYYEHDWSAGATMMYSNNVDDVINVYIVGDPAGTCGYYTYGPDAVAVAYGCNFPGSTTLTHELGHYFSLPHPFYNVLGVQEYVDGSNCSVGGDRFCDTPADFLDDRWSCPYLGNALDPNGDPYDPDETLYMSYSFDQCQNRFSSEQTNAMIEYLDDEREELLSHPAPSTAAITDLPVLLSPVDSFNLVPNDWVTFDWDDVANAEFYHIQVTKYGTFAAPLIWEAITEESAISTWLPANDEYMWRVKPISAGYTCSEYSDGEVFSTVAGTGLQSLISNDPSLSVFPNPVQTGGIVSIRFEMNSAETVSVTLLNSVGAELLQFTSLQQAGENTMELGTENLMPGIYFLYLKAGERINVVKLVIGG